MDSASYERSWNSLCNVVDLTGIFDSEYRQPHSQCMTNTRVTLRRRITRVLDQCDRTSIWLNGLAGVGKTSIAFTIAQEMMAAKRLVGTFFFSHKHSPIVDAIIPTIAYQLALAFPYIQDKIVLAIRNDKMLLSAGKSRVDQIRELVIKPLQMLKDSNNLHLLEFCGEPYAIIIDALDECLSSEEAARLVILLTDALACPDLPFVHVIFTSRPEAHIRTAMPSSVDEISLITRDEDTIQDVRFFLRTSLDKIRTSRPAVFGQSPIPWPSEDNFEALAFKAGGLFVYAAMAMNFISATGHHPQERLDLLLREKSTVGADIDQLYRQIIGTSEDPIAHCRMLASIIHLSEPLSLAHLQEIFHADKTSFALMLEAFSPVILNDGVGKVEIYHASLRDFITDPLRSKQYHTDRAHVHEHLACCCLDFITRHDPIRTRAILASSIYIRLPYPYARWDEHLSMAYPSSKLRNLVSLFTDKALRHWVKALNDGHGFELKTRGLRRARRICLSLKWILRGPLANIVIAWRIHKALRDGKGRGQIFSSLDLTTWVLGVYFSFRCLISEGNFSTLWESFLWVFFICISGVSVRFFLYCTERS